MLPATGDEIAIRTSTSAPAFDDRSRVQPGSCSHNGIISPIDERTA